MPVLIPALVSAGIGAAGTIYASNQANSANKKAINAQQQATDKQLAVQEQQYNQTRQDQAPYRQAGYGALDALLQGQGIGGGSQPAAGSPDWQAYETQHPDVVTEYQRLQSFPEGQARLQEIGVSSPEQFAQWHWTNAGSQQGWDAPPTVQASTSPAPLTSEQQLQQQVGQEPTFGPRQDYQRPGFQQANVGIDQFQASPDYNFRLQEGSRNLNAFNAAKGVLGSGAAMKSLVDYGQNTAAAEYGNWRNYVTGQTDKQNAFNQDSFNSDRAYGTDIYNTDRANSLNRYDTNRAYQTGRTDTTTNNLFNLANMGQGATNATQNAGQAYANNSGNIIQNNANAVTNAFSQTANTNAGLAGSLTGIGQSLVNAFKPKTTTMTSNVPVWV